MTIVIVPPHRWHPLHTTGTPPAPDQPDHRMVTELYHTNPGNIIIMITDSGLPLAVGDPPPCGWTTRTIPHEDHTYQQLTQHAPNAPHHAPTPTTNQ